jgi:phage terminase large subunit-like protein
MSPALRTLESLLLNGQIAHGNHPVLSMCAANATTQTDPAGNRKLSKSKSHGRIDGMVALAMAGAVAGAHLPQNAPISSPWDDPNYSLVA